MICPDDGKIQAYIDKELNEIEMVEIEDHISTCEKCKRRYEKLKTIDSFVFEKFSYYGRDEIKRPKYENVRFLEEKINKKGEFSFMNRYKKTIVAASLGVVITSCVAVQPIRAAISNAVSIFRASDIKGINVTLEDIQKLEKEIESKNMDINIDKIGKVKQEGGENKKVTIEEAKKEIPFNLYMPKSIEKRAPENVNLVRSSKIDFTLNIENINSLMKSLGAKKVFPVALDQKTFTLNLPDTISMDYSDEKSYITITEGKVPEITGPSEENINEVVDALSELPILPSNIQKQLKGIKDWKNTLYVPNFEGSLEELEINGVKAFGHFENNGEYKSSGILFLKDGVLVGINGNVDRNEIIEIAKSMR